MVARPLQETARRGERSGDPGLIDVVRVALVHGYAVTLRPLGAGYNAEVDVNEAREAFTEQIGPSRADSETPMRATRAAR